MKLVYGSTRHVFVGFVLICTLTWIILFEVFRPFKSELVERHAETIVHILDISSSFSEEAPTKGPRKIMAQQFVYDTLAIDLSQDTNYDIDETSDEISEITNITNKRVIMNNVHWQKIIATNQQI